MSTEAMIAVRLAKKEIDQLDKHTKGQLSRAGILRILVHNFLDMSEKEQREFLTKRMFGE